MKTFIVILFLLLAATAAQAVDRTLSWSDNSANEDGFQIQSCPGICTAVAGTFTQIGAVAANVQTFRVLNIALNSTTSYRVRAFNAAGNSGFTNIVVDVIPSGVPNDPANAIIGP